MNILSTERLILSTWAMDDLDDACKLWGDPEVMGLIDMRGGLSRSEVADKIENEIECQDKFGVQYWKATRISNGEFIGCCGLRPYNIEAGIYETGTHIVRNQWGRGYATEGARGVIKYAFENMAIPRLFAGHHPDNTVSGKLLKRLGFEYIGDQFYEPTGLEHPSYKLDNPGAGRNKNGR